MLEHRNKLSSVKVSFVPAPVTPNESGIIDGIEGSPRKNGRSTLFRRLNGLIISCGLLFSVINFTILMQ